MAMVSVDGSKLLVDSQLKLLGLVLRGDEHMALRLQSSYESSAPSQWLWYG